MLIFGKTPNDWKTLELAYRKEWLCVVIAFILGAIIF